MFALILDPTYETLDIADVFSSFIWTDRYIGCGNFELFMPVTPKLLPILKPDNFIAVPESNRLMVIEDFLITTDAEEGDHMTVTGRSLESILERRIIWGQTILKGNFQEGIKKLLMENAIAPANVNRLIPNLSFKPSTDKRITDLTIDTQFFGENLYDTIVALCDEKSLGFRILPEGAGGMVFELYFGEDRSYAQEKNTWVTFSPGFENILSSNYLESNKLLKTAALVAGEGDGAQRKLCEAVIEAVEFLQGLARREVFVDASGVSSNIEDGQIPEQEYMNQLRAKGKEALSETSITKSFEGEIEASKQFVYGRDFFIGDIVQVVNEYGKEATSRVSELVRSHDSNGEQLTPTFTAIKDTDKGG